MHYYQCHLMENFSNFTTDRMIVLALNCTFGFITVIYRKKIIMLNKPLSTIRFHFKFGCRTSSFLSTYKNKLSTIDYALISFPLVTFGLGTWQIQRLIKKKELLNIINDRINQPPSELPENLKDLENKVYYKFKIRGQFDHENEIYLAPRSMIIRNRKEHFGLFSFENKTGVNVITPFKLSDRDLTILVNRGWVPKDKINPNKRLAGQIEGEVTIVGLLNKSEKRPIFSAKNDPKLRIWTYRDVNAMAYVLNVAPIIIDCEIESSPPDGPIGGQTLISIPNNHFQYIVTWYGLSICSSILLFNRFTKMSKLGYSIWKKKNILTSVNNSKS